MHRKVVINSFRRAAFPYGAVTATFRTKSTGTGSRMHRIVPPVPVGGAGTITGSSQLSTLNRDDEVRKNKRGHRPQANAKLQNDDDDTSVAKSCTVYSQGADVKSDDVATPVEPHDLKSAQFPQNPLNEASASKSKVYAQFANSSSRNTGANRKSKSTDRNRDHPHQTRYVTKDEDFVTLGARLKSPVKNKGDRFKRVLPTLNASALFQEQHDDNDTRQDLLNFLRTETMHKRRRAFMVTGHGVPPQLFQDHLQTADSFLRQESAVECSFNNFHGQTTLDNMYVKHGHIAWL